MKALPEAADVVIVGAGIMGLSIAYHLTQLWPNKRIVILDKGYLCGGASGRNGGGVRAQWSSETNIALMKESLQMCAEFAITHRINVWFRRGGYLFLARKPERVSELEASVALQNRHGLSTRIISAGEAKRVVPELNTEALLAASWNPDDAVVFPWPFVWGYKNGAESGGAEVFPFTEVLGFETQSSQVDTVHTSRGIIRCNQVILAAGAWTPEVASYLGIELPNQPHRHEICSTEPLKPFLGPLVADLETGFYCSQSMRGEIVGGISNHFVPSGLDQESSIRFLALYSKQALRNFPRFGALRVLRQWSGCYDITPDGNPIVGAAPGLQGVTLACGFMGHGFMMAPVMGKRIAEHLVRGDHQALMNRWSLHRYETGELLEETMILG